MTIPSAQITSTGVVVPDYADVLAAVQNLFGSIYGADTVLNPNTQDEQWLAVLSQAISDSNQMVAAAYNSFSPTFAQGAGLSILVKLNGLQRNVPSNSQIVVTITGVAGTVITNGKVGDNAGLGQIWDLPVSVTIPSGGTISVTATNEIAGAISAGNSTLTTILTPTLGWQSVTNGSNAASLGSPVESDAALRQRQSVSTGGPALTPLEAISAAIANVAGVSKSKVYENDTGSADGNGVPAHSISAVVEGGVAASVAAAIASKKSEGTGTYGTTSVTVTDQNGVPNTINFYTLAFTRIYVSLTIHALAGYNSAIGAEVKAALVAYVAGLNIGDDVFYTKLIMAANLDGAADGNTFNLTALTLGTSPAPVGTSDIVIAFNFLAQLATADIVLTVT